MHPTTHRFYEDLLALCCAGIFVALGVELFSAHGLLTGGTAGIALVTANLLPLSFGMLFFLVNLPFYYLAWTQLGKRFTVNTFVSVSAVSLMSEVMPRIIRLDYIHPVFSAVVGGMLIGMGLLIMFRHKSSLGGLGILAYYLQNRFNVRAGTFQLAVDLSILAFASLFFHWNVLLLSIIGAIIMNLLVAVNHKPGRYQVNVMDETPTQTDEDGFLHDDCPLDSGLYSASR